MEFSGDDDEVEDSFWFHAEDLEISALNDDDDGDDDDEEDDQEEEGDEDGDGGGEENGEEDADEDADEDGEGGDDDEDDGTDVDDDGEGEKGQREDATRAEKTRTYHPMATMGDEDGREKKSATGDEQARSKEGGYAEGDADEAVGAQHAQAVPSVSASDDGGEDDDHLDGRVAQQKEGTLQPAASSADDAAQCATSALAAGADSNPTDQSSRASRISKMRLQRSKDRTPPLSPVESPRAGSPPPSSPPSPPASTVAAANAQESLPTPDGLSTTEACLLRWIRAVVDLHDARSQVEPCRLRVRETERKLARMRRDQDRSIEEKHEEALREAAEHGIPASLFPIEAPWSAFPWYELLGPRVDCEESLRLAIGLRDLDRLDKYLLVGKERGLTKFNSRIFYEAGELRDLLEAEGETSRRSNAIGLNDDVTPPPVDGGDAQPVPLQRQKTELIRMRLNDAMSAFVEEVDTSILEQPPQQQPLAQILRKRSETWARMISSGRDEERRDLILSVVTDAVGLSSMHTEQSKEQEQVPTLLPLRCSMLAHIERMLFVASVSERPLVCPLSLLCCFQEKEQTQEQEREIEMERYVDMSYLRDGEEPARWAFCTLAETRQAPGSAAPGQLAPLADGAFYPASSFRLHARAPLPFPSYLAMSRNHFNLDWNGERRLKNAVMVRAPSHSDRVRSKSIGHAIAIAYRSCTVCECDFALTLWPAHDCAQVLEWVPSVKGLRPLPTAAATMTEAQQARLHSALRLLDFDSSGSYERDELREALRSAEDLQLSEAELDELIAECGGKAASVLSYDRLHEVLTSGRYRRADDGRYFVLLSLAEAETIRCIMHMRQGKSVIEGSDCALALRCLAAHDAVFDCTAAFPTAPRYQAGVSQTCFRFIDSAMHFKPDELNVLLRSIPAKPVTRRLFFTTVVACRRRLRKDWQTTPLAKVFTLEVPS